MLLATLFTGCMADVSVDVDPDKDGLDDALEAAWEADPGNPDSDGDGYLDGAEVAGNTSPIDADDHPYTVAEGARPWNIDSCRNEIESTGNEPGEVAENLALLNQFGETVRLHDFCDQVVMMIFATFT